MAKNAQSDRSTNVIKTRSPKNVSDSNNANPPKLKGCSLRKRRLSSKRKKGGWRLKRSSRRNLLRDKKPNGKSTWLSKSTWNKNIAGSRKSNKKNSRENKPRGNSKLNKCASSRRNNGEWKNAA